MSGQHSHPSPLRTLWRLLVPLLAVLVLTALVAGALGGAAAWLLRSEAGTAWLIDKLPGLQARGLKGALLSSRFEAEHLEFKVGTTSVVVDGLLADGLSWLWRPDPKAWLALDAKTLTMRRLTLKTGPRGALPATLELVLRLNVDALKIDE